jgi:succinate dehydrogenase/fumarate reductase flavoprotein subunit
MQQHDADELRGVPHRGGAGRGRAQDRRDPRAQATTSAVTDRSLIWNSDLVETLEYDNLIAQAVVDAAHRPRTARRAGGAHAREDSPTATIATG